MTPRARDDLKNIGRYTEQEWGKSQRNAYLRKLEGRFNLLANSPHIGKHRTDICEGFYSFPEGKHIVFYLIGKGDIEIVGVPHKDMDVVSYFFI